MDYFLDFSHLEQFVIEKQNPESKHKPITFKTIPL